MSPLLKTSGRNKLSGRGDFFDSEVTPPPGEFLYVKKSSGGDFCGKTLY